MEFEWLMKLLRLVLELIHYSGIHGLPLRSAIIIFLSSPCGQFFGSVDPCPFFENQTKNGKMSAGQAKTVKKVCKGNNDNCIAIAERIFDKLQTKKIESKLSLLEMLDMLFLRSNSVRTYVLDNFGK